MADWHLLDIERLRWVVIRHDNDAFNVKRNNQYTLNALHAKFKYIFKVIRVFGVRELTILREYFVIQAR